MKINEILNEIKITSSYIPNEILRRRILSLCHNSKHATPTCAFFCKKGALTDGHAFARHAYSNGARIFIAEHELNLPDDAAVLITPSSTDALNHLAVKFYNYPSKELKIVGITGTKGKTTVAISAYKIALSSGIKAGYIGTNGIYYNGRTFETVNTTPDVLELQKALREMADDGVSVVMLEVSSQALWQKRTFGLAFESCVFTNLYPDHIGGCEHPTLEHYINSKKSLFTDYDVKSIIVNADSEFASHMICSSPCKNVITISAKGDRSCSLFATDIIKYRSNIYPGISFDLHSNDDFLRASPKTYNVFMPVPGLYSAENGLLITAICLSIGISLDFIISELAKTTVPGRFEIVPIKSKPNSLFVIDYAHNGASLKAVIDALREYEPKRIICVFGSVGGRTFGRRKELADVARDNADIIIITSDNPNNEIPMNIINEIRDAVGQTDKPVYTIENREDAIKKALQISEDGDYVLFAGKGHETYQLISGKRIPFSERQVLELMDLTMPT